MRREHRLKVHGLPDWTGLDVLLLQRQANLFRRHGAAGVNSHTAEPEIRLAVRQMGVHPHRKPLKCFFISPVDGFLLRSVLKKVNELPAADPRHDIAHPIVITDLLVLVPRVRLSGLRGPKPGLGDARLIVGQQHSAAGGRDDLVAVEGDGIVGTEISRLNSLVCGAQRLGDVLNQHCSTGVADAPDLLQLSGGPVQIGSHHHLGVGVELKCLFQCHRVHVPCVPLRVDKDGDAAFIHHGVHRGSKGHVGAEHGIARLHTGQFHTKVKSSRTGRQRHSMLAPDGFTGQTLHLIDVLADCGHPVGLVCLRHILQLLTTYGRSGKPHFLLKRFHLSSHLIYNLTTN